MADRPPDTTIYQRYAECYYGFETLCDAFQKSMVSHGMENFDVETEFDRYKLWAGSVGAMHAGKTEKLSLDYRLREASFFREQVVRLLGILRQHIDSADEILRGKRRPVEECFLESASDEDSSLGDTFWKTYSPTLALFPTVLCQNTPLTIEILGLSTRRNVTV
ncbi:hypothetical protein SLS55_001279 [Diplodia seriata]|uniref:Uncharacterized protein n=1 Tax=Diplodia seriata TaxID=420778 RepID=A0ABR3CWQ5_9PEZI